MSIESWVPGHATIFFAVPKQYDNPLYMGSLGAGLNFQDGIRTSVSLSSGKNSTVSWNVQSIDGRVSLSVLDMFCKKANIDIVVNIRHTSNLPIGHGISTSGAGAIGTAMVLNRLMSKSYSDRELFGIAHVAEVENKTGLGSVMGQITGGIEYRTKQGGPGAGMANTIKDESPIFLAFLGPLSTKDVLSSSTKMDKITEFGERSLDKLIGLKEPSIEDVMIIGREFSESCGLLTRRVQQLMQDLDQIGEPFSTMAMIGETLIIKPNDVDLVEQWCKKHNINFCQTSITNRAPFVRKTE